MATLGQPPTSAGGADSAAFRSALDMDVIKSTQLLLEDTSLIPHSSQASISSMDSQINTLLQQQQSQHDRTSLSLLLDLISRLLLDPALTEAIAIRFRPLLVDLTARLVHRAISSSAAVSWEDATVRATFCTLARLVGPFEEVYSTLYPFVSVASLGGGPFTSTALQHANPDELAANLMATYRVLDSSAVTISSLDQPWPSEALHYIFSSDSSLAPAGVRLLALEVFALQERLSQATKLDLQHRWIGRPSIGSSNNLAVPTAHDGVAAEIKADSGAETVDVWVLAEEERRRVSRARKACIESPICFLHAHKVGQQNGMDVDSPSVANPSLRVEDLCPLVSNVGGVLLLRSPIQLQPTKQLPSAFVETPGLRPTLSELAMHLSVGLPILLSGPPSCGKTELLSHVATLLKTTGSGASRSSSAALQNHILTIQLGDQSGVDAKQLLGSFISSPTKPGIFEWSEGALTRAVRLGMWVVLEDIDRAGSEVLSTVGRLVEQLGPTKPVGAKPVIDLGSRGKVAAGDGFALFATRLTLGSSTNIQRQTASTISKPTFLGNEHWAEIQMSAPTRQDVEAILSRSFSKLSSSKGDLLGRLIGTWDKVRSATTSAGASKAAASAGKAPQEVAAGALRTATLRDLIKWCRRVENLLSSSKSIAKDPFANPVMQEEIFIETCDVFLGALPSSTANMAPGTVVPQSVSVGKVVDRYSTLVELLAEELGMSSERAWWSLRGRTPELSLKMPEAAELMAEDASKPSILKVGRCELPRIPRGPTSRAQPVSRKFALTKPTLGLLEQLAVCTTLSEPVLLVGETGTGKTTVVQHLASLLGRPMTALNLSQQTESGDLIGAFKPLDPKLPATELHDEWTRLFARTFSSRRNARFMEAERKAFLGGKWVRLAGLWREAARMAFQRKKGSDPATATSAAADSSLTTTETDVKPNDKSRKKRRTENGATEGSPARLDDAEADAKLDADWQILDRKARAFGVQHGSKKRNLVFSFVEGPLVKALRQGDWVLLDEVNLAAAETLDCLSGLLQSPTSSLTLTERGDLEPIPRHPNFRLFACMNPATDVGKKELPSGLRSRFTELYVPSPDSDKDALTTIVDKYIGEHAVGDRGVVMDVAECYAEIRKLAQQHELADGDNQRPHYSIRTLTRALTFATDIAPSFGLRRGLWEGFVMTFTLLLDNKSAQIVRAIIERSILARAKNARAIATFIPPAPKGAEEEQLVQVGPFWLATGPLPLEDAPDYIMTPSVQAKLVGLSRAALTRRFPVLVQGPTSAGKTSAVEYLARRTGHRFVRINNHEHTDIQEYLGSYASDPDTGRLVFHEGLLVKALRQGDWIVLDELNLAPTDVLEALNRLLDDNRELVIPETGEVVRPHPHFMLFATQNPPGLYAGRKVLSRAFRNRFLELHFDDVPKAELETILTNRCAIAPSYAARIVSVFEELQKRRQAGRVFDTKQAFVTLRDLFRWGMREAIGYQQLAENGYMLIAERARRNDDKAVVREVIEQIMKVTLDTSAIYDLHGEGRQGVAARIGNKVTDSMMQAVGQSKIVWTDAVQRLLCLVATALRYNEPVLLVGETGAGKTSVCEVLATAFGRELHSVNCHQNTDTADLLGGMRPLRNRAAVQAAAKGEALDLLNKLSVEHCLSPQSMLEDVAAALSSAIAKLPAQEDQNEVAAVQVLAIREQLRLALQKVNQSTALFEWHDGPLVQAMRAGDHLLLDEISLADDSVLERLNSVLEPGRTLVLAERSNSTSPSANDGSDIAAAQIKGAEGFQVLATMNPGGDYGKKELSPALRNRFTEVWVPHIDVRTDLIRIVQAQWKDEKLNEWTEPILDFADWFVQQVGGIDQAGISLRDLLGWATFMNQTAAGKAVVLSPSLAFAHGASLTIIDGLGALPATAAMSRHDLQDLRSRCFVKVASMIAPVEFDAASSAMFQVSQSAEDFGVGPFSVKMGPLTVAASVEDSLSFSFGAATSASNAMRILRALAVPNKALLLEGSPGVGKTSLISALAKATGNPLTRINLSDQTELVDLFGADLPVEGAGPGEFAWRDAAFLTAMQKGEWVLLDEMNLASQTVLEGLNSCLDHRGTVFLPELGRSFDKHPNFRFFAAQNPHHQGGGRKGLPKSFLNRFTKVHIEELTPDDILQICAHLYPEFNQDDLRKMIEFNSRLHQETMVRHSFGRVGVPWEFNLRDLLRWLTLLHSNLGLNVQSNPIEHLASLYVLRFRNAADRKTARSLYAEVFDNPLPYEARPWPSVTPRYAQFGHALLERGSRRPNASNRLALLQHQLPTLEALADCLQMRWLGILTGPSGSGKTSVVRLLAQLAGARLEEFSMNSGTDTMDLLGTFEQYDPQSQLRDALVLVRQGLERAIEQCGSTDSSQYSQLSSSDRLVERELDHLIMHKNHKVDAAALNQALATLAVHPLLVQDGQAQAAIAQANNSILQHLQVQQAGSTAGSGRFEWTDGPLLRAMKEGHWLLLDNANLCSASVLDRLNSLFEPDGLLVISERGVVDGEVPIVRPHPNFRVFMALDIRHGELSRAMRNRGIEICMVDRPISNDDLDRERLLFLARVQSEDGGATIVKSDKLLMTSGIQSQGFRRGISATIPTINPSASDADELKSMANWAASSLVLRNSSLATSLITSAFVSTTELETNAAVATAAKSYLLRASSAENAALLTHVLSLGGKESNQHEQQASLALQVWSASTEVTEIVSSRKRAFTEGHGLPADFVDRQPNEMSYNPNMTALESAQDPNIAFGFQLDLFAAGLLQQVALRSLSIESIKKDKKILTVLEQSAVIASHTHGTTSKEEEGEGETEQSTIRQIFPLTVALSKAAQGWSSTDATLTAEQASLIKTLLQTSSFLEKLSSSSDLDYSSIQVLVQIMAETVKKLEALGLTPSQTLDRALSTLGGKVNLTSGFAMKTIWDMCLTKAADSRGADLSRQISELLSRIPSKNLSEQAALNALNIAATLSLNGAAWTQKQSEDLLELGHKTLFSLQTIEKFVRVQSDGQTSTSEEEAREAFVGSAMDLSIQTVLRSIQASTSASQVDFARMRGFVELVKQSDGIPLSAAVPVRASLWSLEATGGVVEDDQDKLAAPSADWINRIWDQVGRAGSNNGWIDNHDGPAELFRPMLLCALLDSRSDNVSLEHRTKHDASAKRLAQAASLSTPSILPSRMEQVRGLLIAFANLLSKALKRSIASADRAVTLDLDDGEATISQLAEEFGSIAASDVSEESKNIASLWSGSLSQAADLHKKGSEAMMSIGQAWITLAISILRLYMPNVAIDPVVSQQTRGSFKAFCSESIEAQLRVESSAEMLVTGRPANAFIQHLSEELRSINGSLAAESTQTLPRDSDLKLLTQLYREVHSFVEQVLSPSKLNGLAEGIQHGFDGQIEDREVSLQASILGFAHRLRQTFASLHDIISPILLVLSQVQLGFRTMVQAARLMNRTADVNRHSKVLEALVTFPTAASTSAYGQLELPVKLKASSKSGVLAAPLLMASISGIALDAESLGRECTQQTDVLRRISRTYDQLYQLWSLDREREKQVEEAASSLYKSKKYDEETAADAGAEEREFQQLFPEYADVLDEVNKDPAKTTTLSTTILLKSEHVVDLYRVHGSLFTLKGEVGAGADAIFYSSRTELVRRIMNSHYASLSEKIDQIGAAFQLAAFTSPMGQPIGSSRSSEGSAKFNFYLDPRPEEVSKAIPVVDGLRQRLSQLIADWPEQMVLQHIRDRCDTILRLNSASPVAKVLSALEQLLLHTEDWEGFASSQTSLKLNREQISGQIIEWRRLELSCWARILETQAVTYEETVAEWWFRLFEVLVRGTRSASMEGEESVKDHLRKLIDLLDQFIRSSTFGQYEARLRLLNSFSQFMDLLIEMAPEEESKGFTDVGVVLKNVTAFFWQFNPKVTTTLKQQREILEKEIRNFIKLASWKDINVHALRTSAQKTHRQLHRCIRKFRDILRQPSDPLLAAHLDGLTRKDLPTVITVHIARQPALVNEKLWSIVSGASEESTDTIPQHLVNLAQTFNALKQMGEKHLLPGMSDETASEGISTLCEIIIDRQQELAKLTPAFATEDNEKVIQSLTSRKRKAWTDLLKELRRIGLSAFLKSDVAKRNQDTALIYTQEPLQAVCPPSLSGELFESIEQFHFRLLASLPKVRDALHSHSPDLSTSELQRGVNYIEHCMSLVFGERKRISMMLRAYSQFEKTSSRLSAVHAGGEAPVQGVIRSAARLSFVELADFIQRLRSSLKEISQVAPQHISLSPFGSIGSESILAEVSKLLDIATTLSAKVSRVAAHASSRLPLFFLSVGEDQLLLQAHELVNDMQESLLQGEKACPALSALLRPTRNWIQARRQSIDACIDSIAETADADEADADALQSQSNRVISSILLVAQDLRKRSSSDDQTAKKEEEDDDEKDLPDKAVSVELERLLGDHRALRPDVVLVEVEKALTLAEDLPRTHEMESFVLRQIARMSPFIHEYVTLVQAHLIASANWSRALLKVSHVLCNLMSALASKGFCKPPEETKQEDGEDGETGEQLDSGTGLADGSGAKDVTDQMDDDEPMEELQKDPNQEQGDEEDKTEREKNAREADDDFGGDMKEIDEDEGEADDEEQQDEDEKTDEPDDAVGDVDPLDPNAVDEKMWGNEDEKEDKPSADKMDKDAGGDENDDQQDDSVPKEEDGEKKTSDSKQKKEKAGEKSEEAEQDKNQTKQGDKDGQDDEPEEGGNEGDDKKQEEGAEGEEEEEDQDGEEQKDGLGRKLDEQMQEGENLDLNDNLNMDEGEGDEDKKDDEDEDGFSDLSDDEDPLDQDKRDDRKPEGDDKLEDLLDDEPAKEEVEKAEDQEKGDGAELEESTEEQVAKNDGEEAMDEDAEGEGEGLEDKDRQTQTADEPVSLDDSGTFDQGAEAGEDASAEQVQSSRGNQGRRVEAQQSSAADDGMMDEEEEDTAPTDQDPTAGGGQSRAQRPQPQAMDPNDQAGQAEDANPVRSLGDALEEFRRRFEEIQEATEQGDNADQDGEGMPEVGDVEHVANDDDAEMQALGATKDEEQVQKLGDLAIEDEQDKQGHKPRAEDETVNKAEQKHEPQQLPENAAREQDQFGQQKALMPADIKPSASLTAEKEAIVAGQGEANADADEEVDIKSEEDMTPVPKEIRRETDKTIEEQLQDMRATQAAEERLAKAGDLWRSYTALTADLAFSLCEQLRLILAPTLATRLNGDFRTGKRLNMRKIVPFIASDFAKDKIWLRRTKPSAREYQVLLAVDDSKSMSESRSAHLAYQTVALVSGALSRLEVGDVGICRFGEDVEPLHEFRRGSFDGANLIDKLGFEQRGTNVLKLVEKSLDLLSSSRETRTGGKELWQLEIIISDGICQDHDRLRSLLRRAAEQRVMLVFVIIDSLHSPTPEAATAAARNSILSMNSVKYVTDADGKMQLQMERYLDTFPFDYYVVVRDVEALPEVLAATLRQWAEKIRETET